MSFRGRDFHYRIAGSDIELMRLNGQTIEFAYDPHDLEEAAIYYQDRFVGIANCVQLRRMGESAFVEDEKNRRAARREVKKVINAVHQAIPVPSPETRLERRKEVIPNRECAQPIVTLPACLPAAIDRSGEVLTSRPGLPLRRSFCSYPRRDCHAGAGANHRRRISIFH